jgi:LytS/YehU family sensor histidine kinase
LHNALLVYAAGAAVTQAVVYYRRTRARELQVAKLEGQLARAHLQTLNAQIRPHFLFNTLHTIGQLWRSGRSDDADAVLDHLGSLFHKVQRSTSRFEVPLAEELELVREYLAIEEVRFRDRLHTTVHAANGALECLVPPFILQPIVENAVRHGISAVSTSGTVEVIAEMLARHVRLTVRDDGPGVHAATSQPGTGTGLPNTRERLSQLYGTDAELRIGDGPTGGTIVQIDIPLARADRDPRAHE